MYLLGSSARFARARAYGIIVRRCSTADILRQIYYNIYHGRYIIADILRHKYTNIDIRNYALAVASASFPAGTREDPPGIPL